MGKKINWAQFTHFIHHCKCLTSLNWSWKHYLDQTDSAICWRHKELNVNNQATTPSSSCDPLDHFNSLWCDQKWNFKLNTFKFIHFISISGSAKTFVLNACSALPGFIHYFISSALFESIFIFSQHALSNWYETRSWPQYASLFRGQKTNLSVWLGNTPHSPHNVQTQRHNHTILI